VTIVVELGNPLQTSLRATLRSNWFKSYGAKTPKNRQFPINSTRTGMTENLTHYSSPVSYVAASTHMNFNSFVECRCPGSKFWTN